MILDMNGAIDFGAYADIFRPSQGPLACELFISVRRETNVKQGSTNPQDHRRREMTFASEYRAYEIAAQDPFLSKHVPHSFRRCDIAGVVAHGESVGANYLLQCCFEPITWHALGHTHGTLLHEQGTPLRVAQAQLGHSRMTTTLEVYAHVGTGAQRNAVDQPEDQLFPNVPEFTQFGQRPN
jgi:hypothetical protein